MVDLNVVLVSGVQQSDSVIHLFQILFAYRLLQNIEYSSLRYIVGPCLLVLLSLKGKTILVLITQPCTVKEKCNIRDKSYVVIKT